MFTSRSVVVKTVLEPFTPFPGAIVEVEGRRGTVARVGEEGSEVTVRFEEGFGEGEMIESGISVANAGYLDTALASTRAGEAMFFMNRFGEAETFFAAFRDRLAHHALAFSTFAYVRAFLTLTPGDLDEARARVGACLEVCGWHRDSGGRVAAEIKVVEAEALLMRANLYLLSETVAGFVRAGLTVRECWHAYKSADQLRAAAADVHSDTENGIIFGRGGFNLVLSLLPPLVLRLVKVFGFSSDRGEGLSALSTAVRQNGLRSPLAALALALWQVYMPAFCALDPRGRLRDSAQLSIALDARLPGSAIFGVVAGRAARLRRDPAAASRRFTSACDAQSQWPELAHVCQYELSQTALAELQWSALLRYSHAIALESDWSPSACAYMCGTALCEAGLSSAAAPYMRFVAAGSARKLGGRTISAEDFAVRHARLFMSRFTAGRREAPLLLPGAELLALNNASATARAPRLADLVAAADDALRARGGVHARQLMPPGAALADALRQRTSDTAWAVAEPSPQTGVQGAVTGALAGILGAGVLGDGGQRPPSASDDAGETRQGLPSPPPHAVASVGDGRVGKSGGGSEAAAPLSPGERATAWLVRAAGLRGLGLFAAAGRAAASGRACAREASHEADAVVAGAYEHVGAFAAYEEAAAIMGRLAGRSALVHPLDCVSALIPFWREDIRADGRSLRRTAPRFVGEVEGWVPDDEAAAALIAEARAKLEDVRGEGGSYPFKVRLHLRAHLAEDELKALEARM